MSWKLTSSRERKENGHRLHSHWQTSCLASWLPNQSPIHHMLQGHPKHTLKHRQSQKLAHKEPQPLEQQSIDTEAGMLSGISQKHNMRSSPCRFTEFCNSQCLSHFAAPFIVDRTETSIAESCKSHLARASGQTNSNSKAEMRQWQQSEITQEVIQTAPPPTSICLGARTWPSPHRPSQ